VGRRTAELSPDPAAAAAATELAPCATAVDAADDVVVRGATAAGAPAGAAPTVVGAAADAAVAPAVAPAVGAAVVAGVVAAVAVAEPVDAVADPVVDGVADEAVDDAVDAVVDDGAAATGEAEPLVPHAASRAAAVHVAAMSLVLVSAVLVSKSPPEQVSGQGWLPARPLLQGRPCDASDG
jgi:hypothetical protein